MTLAERFWAKVDRRLPSECWNWTGGKLKKGYGAFWVRRGFGRHNGSMQTASRWAYRLSTGEIPDEMCVLHRCDNTACCNPAHLFLGSVVENNADRDAKGRADHSGLQRGRQRPMAAPKTEEAPNG
jgi:hypothetical protein